MGSNFWWGRGGGPGDVVMHLAPPPPLHCGGPNLVIECVPPFIPSPALDSFPDFLFETHDLCKTQGAVDIVTSKLFHSFVLG